INALTVIPLVISSKTAVGGPPVLITTMSIGPENRGCVLHQLRGSARLVEIARKRSRPDLIGGAMQRRSGSGADCDTRAFFDQLLGDRAPQSLRCTQNECILASKPEIQLSSPVL